MGEEKVLKLTKFYRGRIGGGNLVDEFFFLF